MNVIVLTVGDPEVASTRYRFGQFGEPMMNEGVRLNFRRADRFGEWDELKSYDLVVLQKRLMRVSWVRRLRSASRHLIFDTDDAIWEPHGKPHSLWTRVRTRCRLSAIARAADCCTVPNERLAAHLRSISANVAVVPMALDSKTWHPPSTREPGALRIGWAGAPPNLAYLDNLGGVLREVQAARPEVELHVYCGEAPGPEFPARTIHHPFVPGTEARVVRTFDIGLLPLPQDAFAAGKSPIKALQYAACGVPCIASPVGATCELVVDGITGLTAASPVEWRDALLRLIDDPELRRSLGAAARERFVAQHSLESVQARMLEVWRKTIGAR